MKSIKNYLSLVEDGAGYGALDLAKDAGAGAAGMAVVGKELGTKQLSKLVPGLGSGLSLKNAWDRFQKGDRTGAVISALAAAGYLIPGPAGWVVGGMGDAANVGRDLASKMTNTAVNEDFNMNSADHIKAIKTKLAQIDEQFASKVLPIGADAFPTMYNVGKQNLDDLLARVGTANQAVPKVAGTATQAVPKVAGPSADDLIKQIPTGQVSKTRTGPAAGDKPYSSVEPKDTAQAMKRAASSSSDDAARAAASKSNNNISKSAAALAAAGGLAYYGASPDGSSNPPGPGKQPGGIASNPPATAAGGLTAEEEQELALLADKLGKHMGSNPQLDALLLRHTKHRGNAGIPQP